LYHNQSYGQLKGVGTYKVDPNNNFRQLVFKTQNTNTKQTATLAANAAGGNWDATQTLAAANYNGWATLVTQNAQLMLIYTDSDAPVLNCDVN